MNKIIHEVEVLIAEMNALDKFNDDQFILYFEREEEMQDRLETMEKAGEITREERKNCSDRLAEAFGKLRSKLSFCNL